jgi:dienelactone hydrolase
MDIKHIRSIVVSVCLGCLAPSLALAQPKITTQPIDRFVDPGKNASFSVACTGVPPITFQWLFNGVAMADATNRTLLVTNAQAALSGYYSVIVANPSGSVMSQVARLKVFVPAPHNFTSIEARSDRTASLTFTGETTATFGPYYDLYPLETSWNLVDWTPLALLQRTNAALDTLQFLDTDAPKFSQRFYRLATNLLLTPVPQPTGPYPVGTFSMMLTDPSRTNKVRHTSHQFMITFWYPAVPQAGLLPGIYVEPQVALRTSLYNLTAYGGGNFGSQVAAFFSHSLSNAPLATNSIKYPVVLYSPGYLSHRRDNTDKAEDLASWGYVVVGLDNRDTFVSVFPNGTVVYGQSQLSDTGSLAVMVARIEDWLLDQKLVLDELEILNAGDPRLGGRLDLDKIGAFGWSLGGATAAQLCLRDPRCKAGVGFDGTFCETNLLTQTLGVPYLFFCEDDLPAYESPPNDDRLPVFNHMVTNAYWVKLVSTVHASFADPSLIVDSASLRAVWGTPTSGQFLPPARASQIIRAYLLSFFNKFLKGLDDHLLDGPSPAYPEVEQFLKK